MVAATPVMAARFKPRIDIDRPGGGTSAPPQFGQLKSSPTLSHTSRWLALIQHPSRFEQRPGVRMM
jgi:hypothetical protein